MYVNHLNFCDSVTFVITNKERRLPFSYRFVPILLFFADFGTSRIFASLVGETLAALELLEAQQRVGRH